MRAIMWAELRRLCRWSRNAQRTVKSAYTSDQRAYWLQERTIRRSQIYTILLIWGEARKQGLL